MGAFVLDKNEIDVIKKEFYKVCPLDFIKEMIVSIYGEESKTYAERFEISDMIAIKYKMVVLDNVDYIQNKNVGDIGCNNGLWPVLFALHGAKSVTGIEPRSLFMQGAKKFIQKHNLPVKLYLGDHNTSLPILQKNNTESLVLMSVDDLIPGFEDFLYNCSNTEIKNYILQCSTISDDCMENTITNTHNNIGFTVHYQEHNSSPRSGFNPYTEIIDENGFQSKLDDSFDLNKTVYIKNVRSEKYLQYILTQNKLKIVSNKKPKLNMSNLVPYRQNLHDSITYHWLTAIKI
jgi:hypothetical protein